eukprot:GGOE01054880.1.p1 GENE.GGOE01054880.1~~GGOE01054880.1.p1  ORF type:complete len:207 (-),score=40.20 GGOE01054880.1:79-699(-)
MEGTAEEIYRQTGGKLDMIVMTAGTGGTLSGTARRLKQLIPNLKVIGVDPHGSILHDESAPIHTYKVEGIGYDFIPKVLDRSVVDEWAVTDDAGSFKLARQMIREEGLLCGGSSGAAMVGAAMKATSLGPNQRCLVLLPDGIRNYMTKFLDDKWMKENGFEIPTARPAPCNSCPFGCVLNLLSTPAMQMGLLTSAAFAIGFAFGRK